jgi:hypothetical protein
MAACSLSAESAAPSPPSSGPPAPSAVSTSDEPDGDDTALGATGTGFFSGTPRPGRTIVAMTEAGCRMYSVEGPLPADRLGFVGWNTTRDVVAFDIGMLADGHTFDELVSDIEEAMQTEQAGGPVAQRPRYFHGSIRGDTTFLHGGAPGPSLLRLGTLFGGRMTWSHHPGAFRYRGEPLDPRGTWAIICYQRSEGPGLEPIGVLGPVEVGRRSP